MADDVERAGPWAVLGISERADEDEIRAAYLRCIKEHPPDRDPQAFERVRDAYAALRDPRERIARLILSADPEAPIASILTDTAPARRFAGIEAWLAALRE